MKITLLSHGSSKQPDYSERKWEGTLSHKLLKQIEKHQESEFLKLLQSKSDKKTNKVELRKPDFEKERLWID